VAYSRLDAPRALRPVVGPVLLTRWHTLLGDKESLLQQIHEITGIVVSALQGEPLTRFDVEERFRRAEARRTTREEDWAYSLLGIFDIFISPYIW
jgi:hypothetical protein